MVVAKCTYINQALIQKKLSNLFYLTVSRYFRGQGGGQGVNMLALYSDDPRSNPTDIYIFFVKIVVEKNEKNWPGSAHFYT